jgi:membrane protein DedA with SNARE-associated domain
MRLRALARGERFYDRYGVVAVYFTPAWMAGVARMHWKRFLPANAIAALVWALVVGVGAYFAGPPILGVVHGIGLIGMLAILAAVAIATGAEALRRRRRRT